MSLFPVLQLKQKAKLNKNVKTIALPKKDANIPANINCSVAGWGITEPTNKRPSSVLKEAVEMIQFNFECSNIEKHYFTKAQMICTKFNKKRGEMCQVIKQSNTQFYSLTVKSL